LVLIEEVEERDPCITTWVNVLVEEGIEELTLIPTVWQPVTNRNSSIGSSSASEILAWLTASSGVDNETSTTFTPVSVETGTILKGSVIRSIRPALRMT
jgi:hypothetical protein